MCSAKREGIAKAKAVGKYKGRAGTAMAKTGEVEKLLTAGVNPTEVTRKLGIAGAASTGDERAQDQALASVSPAS